MASGVIPDGCSSDSLVAILVSVIVGGFVVGVVIVLIVRRRRRKQTDQKPERSGSDGPRGQAVYENQGFHDQPARHHVVVSSSVNPRDMSEPRDSARRSDASNDYLTPMNVYDGLANRNIEHNPYDALTNQNNTYEGLSQNRNETRTYDSFVVSRGQSEDYKIPDTTSKNDTRLTEVDRNSSEYYNQSRLKKSGILSSPQAASSS
ncbi:uncharacterized protein [Littorina saxatilis]|uniref:uncharacterized protein n=1 Tax=Littorina saxatilis TaxID=31220 RepID=UPI0038B474C8